MDGHGPAAGLVEGRRPGVLRFQTRNLYHGTGRLDHRRLDHYVTDNRILRDATLTCSAKRHLQFRLNKLHNVVPFTSYISTTPNRAIGSVTILAQINHPAYFIVVNARFSRGNRRCCLLSHTRTRHHYQTRCLSALRTNDIVPYAIARVRGFNTFYSVNYNVTTLLPVSYLSIDHVTSPTSQIRINRRLLYTVGGHSIRKHVILALHRLLNA